MVNVAQLVEHQVVALRVVGSIPTIHPTKIQKVTCKSLKNTYTGKIFIRGVAQLVAHSLWERGVVSSSLATPTNFKGFF